MYMQHLHYIHSGVAEWMWQFSVYDIALLSVFTFHSIFTGRQEPNCFPFFTIHLMQKAKDKVTVDTNTILPACVSQ